MSEPWKILQTNFYGSIHDIIKDSRDNVRRGGALLLGMPFHPGEPAYPASNVGAGRRDSFFHGRFLRRRCVDVLEERITCPENSARSNESFTKPCGPRLARAG